jgi:copper chaperone CopZ
MKTPYAVKGMHCGSCVEKVTKALQTVPGVQAVSVDLATNTAEVVSESPLDVRVLQGAVAVLGDPFALMPYERPRRTSSFFVRARRTWPLFAMLLLVTLLSFARNLPFSESSVDWHSVMADWMGFFFIIFGGLKVLNLKNFAVMYQGYDLVAKQNPWWGYVYPFIEVGLGILFITRQFMVPASFATIVLMSVGMVGIYKKLRTEGEVQCACLGGFFNVPVTWLTMAENGVMVLMGVWMLW